MKKAISIIISAVLLICAVLIPCVAQAVSASRCGHEEYGIDSAAQKEASDHSSEADEPLVEQSDSEVFSETEPKESEPEETETTLELVLTVPIKEGELPAFSANAMPNKQGVHGLDLSGFVIAGEDGTFYTLTYGSTGKLVNLSENRVICDFSEHSELPNEWIIDYVLTENDLVFELNTGLIVSCDLKTGKLTEYPAAKELAATQGWLMVPKLRYVNGEVLVGARFDFDGVKEYYTLNGEKASGVIPFFVSYDEENQKDTIVRIGEKTLSFPARTSRAVYTELTNGNLLEKLEVNRPEEDKTFTDVWYAVYDKDGNVMTRFCSKNCVDRSVLCPCDFDFDEFMVKRYYPHEKTVGEKNFRNAILTKEIVSCDGTIYELVAYETHLEIYRIYAGYEPLLLINQSEFAEKNQAMTRTNPSLPELINQITRATVTSRANSMKDITWNFKRRHYNNAYNMDGNSDPFATNANPVKLPRYLRNDAFIQNPNASPIAQIGIPYSSGGFNGLDNTESFANNINISNAISGNIRMSSNTVNGTVGLDCCGFVTSACNFGTHLGLSVFTDYANANNNNKRNTFDDLSSMDWIITDSHIMFKYDSTQVFDCQSGRVFNGGYLAEKVSIRPFLSSDISNSSTVIYYHVPYHTHTFHFEYDVAEHWQMCSACGLTRPRLLHSYNNGSNKCRICGYIRQELPF